MARTARRQRKKRDIDPRLILVGAIALIVLAIGVMVVTADNNRRTTNPLVAERTATDFTLPGLVEDVSLADFRGRYVLVNFWASWCPPCKAEMPDLYAYHRQYQERGFTLLAVNVGEDKATVEQFLQANGFDFPVALDMSGAVFNRYGGDGLPSSYLIGPDGKVVKTWPAGRISRETLDRDVTPLLRG